MIRRILPLAGILAGFVLAPSAGAAQGASACQLDGTATTSKALNLMDNGEFTLTFAGTLHDCATEGGYPETSAIISAGKKITIGGVDYRPVSTPSAAGNCTGVSTNLTKLFIQWNNAKYSLLVFNSSGGVVAPLSANFQPASITLTRVVPDPVNPQHTTDTFPLTYAGDTVGGLFLLKPDYAQCNAGGVTSIPVTGALIHGNTA